MQIALPTLTAPLPSFRLSAVSPAVTTLFLVINQSIPSRHWFSQTEAFNIHNPVMHLELQQAAVHLPAKGASIEKEFMILTQLVPI